MDLIEAYPASFIATDHVAAEIVDTYPEQQAQHAAALNAAQITEQRIDDLVRRFQDSNHMTIQETTGI